MFQIAQIWTDIARPPKKKNCLFITSPQIIYILLAREQHCLNFGTEGAGVVLSDHLTYPISECSNNKIQICMITAQNIRFFSVNSNMPPRVCRFRTLDEVQQPKCVSRTSVSALSWFLAFQMSCASAVRLQ